MGPNKSVVVNYAKLHHMKKTLDSEKAVGVIWPQWLYGVQPSTNYKVIGIVYLVYLNSFYKTACDWFKNK